MENYNCTPLQQVVGNKSLVFLVFINKINKLFPLNLGMDFFLSQKYVLCPCVQAK